MKINPYLNFNGDCEEAFKFYEKALGGKIEAMMPHGGTPAAEHVPKEWHSKIMHACLLVDDIMLMASDAPPGMYKKPEGIYVSLGIKEPADAERIYAALVEGGSVTMEL